jgi:predicted TPR repeat methyltransferase
MHTIHVTADAAALCQKAAQLIDAGRLETARPLLAAARALAPSSPELIMTCARLNIGDGAWDQASKELDGGIIDAPTHAGLRKCRADLRRRMGDFEGAARDAAEAVIADRGDPQAMAILGTSMHDLGRMADAVACFREAVSRAPAELSFRQAFASTLETAGNTEAALKILTDGIALRPDSVPMRNAAIKLCFRHRDYRQAVRLAEQACSAGIGDATTYGFRGHALSSLGQQAEAADAYQEALKLGPEDPYMRHLVAATGAISDSDRAPAGFVRAVYDAFADHFEGHLISLGYAIPGAIRNILRTHPAIVAGLSLGPVLDLGCGTGMVALTVGDLPLTSIVGVDLSPRMLAHAEAKHLYAELHEADIVTDLAAREATWPLILAADVLCYFGALENLLDLVHRRLESGGWFIFSVQILLPDHDGVLPGNGHWALQSQGRYVHNEHYVYEAICAAGFRVLRMDRLISRHEAGTDVPSLLFAIERIHHGA